MQEIRDAAQSALRAARQELKAAQKREVAAQQQAAAALEREASAVAQRQVRWFSGRDADDEQCHRFAQASMQGSIIGSSSLHSCQCSVNSVVRVMQLPHRKPVDLCMPPVASLSSQIHGIVMAASERGAGAACRVGVPAALRGQLLRTPRCCGVCRPRNDALGAGEPAID